MRLSWKWRPCLNQKNPEGGESHASLLEYVNEDLVDGVELTRPERIRRGLATLHFTKNMTGLPRQELSFDLESEVESSLQSEESTYEPLLSHVSLQNQFVLSQKNQGVQVQGQAQVRGLDLRQGQLTVMGTSMLRGGQTRGSTAVA